MSSQSGAITPTALHWSKEECAARLRVLADHIEQGRVAVRKVQVTKQGKGGPSWAALFEYEDRGPDWEKPEGPRTQYLIEELWLDGLENHEGAAVGYTAVAVVATREEADAVVEAAGKVIGDGWPIPRGDVRQRKRWRELPVLAGP